MSRATLSRDGGGHRLDAEDVKGAAPIVANQRALAAHPAAIRCALMILTVGNGKGGVGRQ